MATAVVTPEAVPIDLDTAGIGSRCLALFIDWAIQLVTLLALLTATTFITNATGLEGGPAAALFFLLSFLILFGYPTAMETLWRGRTLGKAAMGLRVVTVEGAPVRFRHAAIRAALGFIDFLLTSGAAAVIASLVSARSQRLGDMVAGTIVLRERTGLKAPTAVGFAVPYGLEAFADTLDLARIGGDEYRAVRAFLLRAPSLPPHVRGDLAVRLAGPLAGRVTPPPPAWVHPELFLVCVAAVYQRRHAPTHAQPPPWGAPEQQRVPWSTTEVPHDTRGPQQPQPDQPQGDGGFAPLA